NLILLEPGSGALVLYYQLGRMEIAVGLLSRAGQQWLTLDAETRGNEQVGLRQIQPFANGRFDLRFGQRQRRHRIRRLIIVGNTLTLHLGRHERQQQSVAAQKAQRLLDELFIVSAIQETTLQNFRRRIDVHGGCQLAHGFQRRRFLQEAKIEFAHLLQFQIAPLAQTARFYLPQHVEHQNGNLLASASALFGQLDIDKEETIVTALEAGSCSQRFNPAQLLEQRKQTALAFVRQQMRNKFEGFVGVVSILVRNGEHEAQLTQFLLWTNADHRRQKIFFKQGR